MADTPNLGLPLLAAAQAQKHVTHNDALMVVDALLHCAILDKDLAAPPAGPPVGARYIVAAPGSGAWAGHIGAIAAWQDGAWRYVAPRAGFIAFVLDESLLYFHTGSAWVPLTSALTAIQNLALLGIGTTADPANPFSAKLNAALWTARATGEGGTGDLRYTLNKQAVANTLSLLFQTGYSGRLEMGLIGSDSPALKVSPNGTSWSTALSVDPATGGVDHLAASTDIASASTVDLGAQATLKVRITGTTAITSFGSASHKLRFLHFSGTLTLTNGAALVCPGGANIVTAAGDTAIATSDSSGVWTIRHYQRAALAPGQASSCAGNLLPDADNTRSLGSSACRWNDLWSYQQHVDAQFYMGLSGGSLPVVNYDTGDYSSFDRSGNTYGWAIGSAAQMALSTTALYPVPDNARTLGTSVNRWSDGYINNLRGVSNAYFAGGAGRSAQIGMVDGFNLSSLGLNGASAYLGSGSGASATYSFGVNPNGTITFGAGMTLGTSTSMPTDTWSAQYHVDTNFGFGLSGGNPQFVYDAGDSFYFDRASNQFNWAVGSALAYAMRTTDLIPGVDNARSLGISSLRWSQLFAATSTIATSDQRLKTPLRPYSDAELDAWGDVKLGVYQWLDSVAGKGADSARLHAGTIAQQLREAFAARGLDAHRYALFCEDRLTARVRKTRTVSRPAIEIVAESLVEIVVGDDGRPVQRTVTREVERPKTRMVEVVDEAGLPVTHPQPRVGADGTPVTRQVQATDAEGRPLYTQQPPGWDGPEAFIPEPVMRPEQVLDEVAVRHPVPVMETVEEPYEAEEETGETRLGLRYEQCLVVEAAWQRRRGDRLEARVAALEQA